MKCKGTVAETPRRPEHCIAWAMFAVQRTLANPAAQQIYEQYAKQFPKPIKSAATGGGSGSSNASNKLEGQKLNKDSPDHMRFIYDRALERANAFGIEGVTYMLTMGVVKNIIPAIASTNALIAAACTNEVWKAMSWASQAMNNYYMYIGTSLNKGIYTSTYELKKKIGCPVCDPTEVKLSITNKNETLNEFIGRLKAMPDLQLEKPSIRKFDSNTGSSFNLFMQAPPPLRKATEANLTKKMTELVDDGDVLNITDPVFPRDKTLEVKITIT